MTTARPPLDRPDPLPASGAGGGPILFFDGVCNLCDGLVRVALARDRRRRLRFAPLQSPFAQRFLLARGHAPQAEPPATVLLWDGARLWDRSEAALRLCAELAAPWSWLAVLRAVPRPVRDAIYEGLARRRYRWFGRRRTCRRPAPAERERFLDG